MQKPEAAPSAKPDVSAPTEKPSLQQEQGAEPVTPESTEKVEPKFVHKPMSNAQLAQLAKDNKIKSLSPVYKGLEVLNKSPNPMTAKDIVAVLTEKHEHTKNMLTTAFDKLVASGKVKKLTAPDGQTHYFIGDVEGVESAATQGPKQPDPVALPMHDHLRNLGIKQNLCADIANALQALGAGGKEFTPKEFVQHVVANGDPAVGWYGPYALNWIKVMLPKKGIVALTPDGKCKVAPYPETPTGECPKGHKTYLKPAPDHCPTCGTPMAPGSEAEVSAPDPVVKAEPAVEQPAQAKEDTINEIMNLLGLEPTKAPAGEIPQAEPAAPAPAPVTQGPKSPVALFDSIGLDGMISAAIEGKEAALSEVLDGMSTFTQSPKSFYVNQFVMKLPGGVSPYVAGKLFDELVKREAIQVVEPAFQGGDTTFKAARTWAANLVYGKNAVDERIANTLAVFSNKILSEKPNADKNGVANVGRAALHAVASLCMRIAVTDDMLDKAIGNALSNLGVGVNSAGSRAMAIDALEKIGVISSGGPNVISLLFSDMKPMSAPKQPPTVEEEPAVETPEKAPDADMTPKPMVDAYMYEIVSGSLDTFMSGIGAPKDTQGKDQIRKKLVDALLSLTGKPSMTGMALGKAISAATGINNGSMLSGIIAHLDDAGVLRKDEDGHYTVHVYPAPAEPTSTDEPEDEATVKGEPHPTIPLEEHMAKVEKVCARLHLNDEERGKLETALAGLYGQSGGLSKQMTREYFQEAMGLKDIPFGWTAAVNTVDYLAQEGLLQESPEGYTPNIATPTGECKNHHHTYKKPVPTHCPTCGTLMSPIEVMQPEGEADSAAFSTSSISQKVAITEALKDAGLQVTSKMKDSIKEALYELPPVKSFSDEQFLEALTLHAPHLQPHEAASLAIMLCKHGILVSQDDGSFKFGAATPKLQLESPDLHDKLESVYFPGAVYGALTKALPLCKHYHGDKPVSASTILDEIETYTGLSAHDVEMYAAKLESAGILTLSKDAAGEDLWTLNFDVHDASENEPIKKLPAGMALDDALQTIGLGTKKQSLVKAFLVNLKKEYGETIGAVWMHDLMATNGVSSADIQELVDVGIMSFSDDDQVYELKYTVGSSDVPKNYGPGKEGLNAALHAAGLTDTVVQQQVHQVLTKLKQDYTNGVTVATAMIELNNVLDQSQITAGQAINALIAAGLMTKMETTGPSKLSLNYGGDIPDKGVPGTLKAELANVLSPYAVYGDEVLGAVESVLADVIAAGEPTDIPLFVKLLTNNIADVLTGDNKGLEGGIASAISDELQHVGMIKVDNPHEVTFAHLVGMPTAKCKNGHNTYLVPVPTKCTTCGCSMQSAAVTGAAEVPAEKPASKIPDDYKQELSDAISAVTGGDMLQPTLDAIVSLLEAAPQISVGGLADKLKAHPMYAKGVLEKLVTKGLATKPAPNAFDFKVPGAPAAEPATGIDFSAFKSAMQNKGIPENATNAVTSLYNELNNQAEYTISYLEAKLKEAGVSETHAMKALASLTSLGFLKDIVGTDKYEVTKPATAPAADKHVQVRNALKKQGLDDGEIYAALKLFDAMIPGKNIDHAQLVKNLQDAGLNTGSAIQAVSVWNNFGYLEDVPNTNSYKVVPPGVEEPAAEKPAEAKLLPSAMGAHPVTTSSPLTDSSDEVKQYASAVSELLKSDPTMDQWEASYPGIVDEIGKDHGRKLENWDKARTKDALLQELSTLGLAQEDAEKFLDLMVKIDVWRPAAKKYTGEDMYRIVNLEDDVTGTCPNGHKTHVSPKPKYCPTCGKPFVEGTEIPSAVLMPNEVHAKVSNSTVLSQQAKQVASKLTEIADMNGVISPSVVKQAMEAVGVETYASYSSGSNPVDEMQNVLVHAGILLKKSAGTFVVAPLSTPAQPGLPYTKAAYDQGLIKPLVLAAGQNAIKFAQDQLETGGPKTVTSKALALVMASKTPLTLPEVLKFVGGGSAPSTVAKNKVIKMLMQARNHGVIQFQQTDKLLFCGGWAKEEGFENVPAPTEAMKATPLADVLTKLDPNMLKKHPHAQLAIEDMINLLASTDTTSPQVEWHEMLKDKAGVSAGPERVAITKALLAAGKINMKMDANGNMRFGAPAALSNYSVETPHLNITGAVPTAINATYNTSLSQFSSDQLESISKTVASTMMQAKSTPMTTADFKEKVGIVISDIAGISEYKAKTIADNILTALSESKSMLSEYDSAAAVYWLQVRIDPGLSVAAEPGQLKPPTDPWKDAMAALEKKNIKPMDQAAILTAIKSLQDGETISVSKLNTVMDDHGAPNHFSVYEALLSSGILEDVENTQDYVVHMPKPVEAEGKDEVWSSLTSPTGTCPSGHKTYKAPAPLYCPTCGKKMQQASGVPSDVSTYNPVVNDAGEMLIQSTPLPTKDTLKSILSAHVTTGEISQTVLESGLSVLLSEFAKSNFIKPEDLPLSSLTVAEQLVIDGILLKNYAGNFVHGKAILGDGTKQLVPYSQQAEAAGEITPWVLDPDSYANFEKMVEAHGTTALVQQSVKAAKLLRLILKNNSNAGVTTEMLQETGEMPPNSAWMTDYLVHAGLLQVATASGEPRYFVGGWQKVTTAPGAIKPMASSSSSVVSVAGALTATGVDSITAGIFDQIVKSMGQNVPHDSMDVVNKIGEFGLPASEVSSALQAMKATGLMVSNASENTVMFVQPNVPPCSAPMGSTVPYNLDDYNAGKILAVPDTFDAKEVDKVLTGYSKQEHEKMATALSMLAKYGNTFTQMDVENIPASGIPAAGAMLDDLVEGNVLQRFKYTDENGNTVTKYFFGHWEKKTEGPLALPPEAKTPTGLCKNGHKTYVTPKPHNCPTCGVVLDTLEAGLKDALMMSATCSNEGNAEKIVQYVLKKVEAGGFTSGNLSSDLGFSMSFGGEVLNKLKSMGILQATEVTTAGFPIYTLVESKPMVLTQAPAGVTVAATASTPHGDYAPPPKTVYDEKLAAAGILKPVFTEYDHDAVEEAGLLQGTSFDSVLNTVVANLAEMQKKMGKPMTGVLLATMLQDGGFKIDTSNVIAALAAAAGVGIITQQGSDINTATFVHGYWTPSSAAPAAAVNETVETKSNLPTSKSFEAIVAPHFDKQTAKFLSDFLLINNGQTMANTDVGQAMVDAGMSGGQAGAAMKKLHDLGFVTGIDSPHMTFNYPDPENDADISALGSIVANVIPSSHEGHELSYPVWLALRELQQDKGLTSYATVCSKLQSKLGIGSNLAYELADKLKSAGCLLAHEDSGGITVLMPAVVDSLKPITDKPDMLMSMLKTEFGTEKWEHYPPMFETQVAAALKNAGMSFMVSNFAQAINMSISEADTVVQTLCDMHVLHKMVEGASGVGTIYSVAAIAELPTGKCDNGHNTYFAPMPDHCPTCGTPMNHNVSSGKLNLQPELQGAQPATPDTFADALKQNFLLNDANAKAFGQQLYLLTLENAGEGVSLDAVMKAFNTSHMEVDDAPATYADQLGVVKMMTEKGMLHEFLPGKYEVLLGPPQKSPDKPLTATDAQVTQHDVQDEVAKLLSGLGHGVKKWDSASSKKPSKYPSTSSKVRVYFGGATDKDHHPYFIEINPDGTLNMTSLPLSVQGQVQEHVEKGLQKFYGSKLVNAVKPKMPTTTLKVKPVAPAAPAEKNYSEIESGLKNTLGPTQIAAVVDLLKETQPGEQLYPSQIADKLQEKGTYVNGYQLGKIKQVFMASDLFDIGKSEGGFATFVMKGLPEPVVPVAPTVPKPLQVQTKQVTDTHGMVPKEFLNAPTFSSEPLELTLPLISGAPAPVEKKVVPKEVPKGPKIFSYSAQEAIEKHTSWSAGGKGQAVAKAMEAAGAKGMTFDEIMTATPQFIADEAKKKSWATTSLNTILDAGKSAKCIYEVPGSSPTRYALGMIEEPETKKTNIDPAKLALPTKPPDSFIPHDAPPGSDHRSYYAAARLGFNLHDDVQRAAWESSPYYELIQGLAVNPRTGHSLGLSGVSKDTMRMLVERGIVTQDTIPAWNEANFAKGSFKLMTGQAVMDKPALLPPPTIVEYGADGKVAQVHSSAALEDAILGVLKGKTTMPKATMLLKFMASDPGRAWAYRDLSRHIDVSGIESLKADGVLRMDGSTYRINWPLMISATNDQTKPICPKCNVRHRDAHLCPKAAPTTKKVPAKVPLPGTYKIPIADVAVSPLTTVATVTDNDSEPPITTEQATSLLKTQGIAVKKGSKMAHLIELLHNPMNSADISVAMTNLGFKGNANGAVKEALDAGIIVKMPAGKFVLKGHGNKQSLPLPGEAGPLVSSAKSQPHDGVESIRRQFSADHPIQRMAPHHAQRFAELLSYMIDASATDTTTAADRTIGSTVTHLSKRMHRATQDIVRDGTGDWAGNAGHESKGAKYCSFAGCTLEQMGIANGAPYKGSPSMKPVSGDGGGHWSSLDSTTKAALKSMGAPNAEKYMSNEFKDHYYFTDPDDPDAPMFMRLDSSSEATAYDSTAVKVGPYYYAKLPSRAEIMLQQYAATQAAFLHNNVTSMGISRRVKSHVHGYIKEEAAMRQGLGAHLSVRHLTGWSSKPEDVGVGGPYHLHSESMPVHQIWLHYGQKIDGHNVFSSLSSAGSSGEGSGEREILVIAHPSVTQDPVPSAYTSMYQRFARRRPTAQAMREQERERTRTFPPPLIDPDMPEGFGRYVTNPDGIHYWVTNKQVTVLLVVDCSGFGSGNEVQAPVAEPEIKQAQFDLSVADAVGGMVGS